MEYGRAHFGSEAPLPERGPEPGERRHGPERGEISADQILHSDGAAVGHDHEIEAPPLRVGPRAAGPDPAQPLPLALRAVLVQGHRVVERHLPWIEDAIADDRDQPLKQIVRCSDERQTRRRLRVTTFVGSVCRAVR